MTYNDPPDLTQTLDRIAYEGLIDRLSAGLPPPFDSTPEALQQRDAAAMAQVDALCPADADQLELATQFVIANAQAMECLRLANARDTGLDARLDHGERAQDRMQQAQVALDALLRKQTERKRPAPRPPNGRTSGRTSARSGRRS